MKNNMTKFTFDDGLAYTDGFGTLSAIFLRNNTHDYTSRQASLSLTGCIWVVYAVTLDLLSISRAYKW